MYRKISSGILIFFESENKDLKRIFSGTDLTKLIFPLVIELMLTLLGGMIDSVMVSSAGEAAVSGGCYFSCGNTSHCTLRWCRGCKVCYDNFGCFNVCFPTGSCISVCINLWYGSSGNLVCHVM